MTTRDNKVTVGGAVLLLVLFVGAVALSQLREASRAADYSAHAALAAEIEQRLATIPRGQRYPDSLSQLRLTYPDGGSTSLLSRFTYRSTGTGCTVRTVLRGQEFVHAFP